MKKIINTLENLYLRVLSSIAFYPTMVAVSGLLLFYVVTQVEYSAPIISLKENFSYLFISNREEARLVLGTLVGSIISLMVFSFSMVMVVLSRASTNLTPRVLPGLISNRSHQFVLGYYIGTIIYCLLIIINFQDEGEFHIPSLGIFIAMGSGLLCLCLFIYFIHSIASSIQVSFILHSVYSKCRSSMKHTLLDTQVNVRKLHNTENWLALEFPGAGYFNKIDCESLAKYLQERKLKIKLNKSLGEFIYYKSKLIEISSNGIDKEIEEDIWSYFHVVKVDMLEHHYTLGFKHIAEIAVKSLSPGINDPGTAIKSLEYLTLLYQQRFELHERQIVTDSDDEIRLLLKPIDMEQLFYSTFVPIREYGKHDVMVMLKILEAMESILLSLPSRSSYWDLISNYIQSLRESVGDSVSNSLDRRLFEDKLNSIQQWSVDR